MIMWEWRCNVCVHKILHFVWIGKTASVKEGNIINVVQRPPDIAPKNTENESRKLHTEYTQGNV
jgi:hypothetical protein